MSDTTICQQSAAVTTIRVLVVFDAATFVLAAMLHLGVRVPLGFAVLAEPRIIPASIVEGLCGLFLAVSVYALLNRQSWGWLITTAAHVFALAGVLLGMFSLAIGFGPRTELNDIYHRLMLLLLIIGLVLLLTPIARSSLGRCHPAV